MESFSMVAIVRQTYNGRALNSGDEFEVPTQAEVDDLIAVRMAQRKKRSAAQAPVSPPPPPVVKNRAAEAVEFDDDAGSPPTRGKPDEGYNRRDMRAKR